MSQVKEGDIYLTQDDCLFYPYRDWLRDFCAYAEKGDIGLLTSCGLCISGPTYMDKLAFVGFWDCYIPRRTIDAVGLTNPEQIIGDDIEYAYKVKQAGLKIINFNDYRTIVHHQKRTTPHSDDSEERKSFYAKMFRDKFDLK